MPKLRVACFALSLDGYGAPDKFLTVAARAGMLPDIDNLMMRKAVATLGTLPQHCHVAVNVSAETMAQPAFASSVIELLRASQLDPARLHLEVVESSFLQASSPLVEAMRTLAAAGCRWWADDFGTGFSSIEHLRDLPIHGIKLDVSFTRGLITPDDRSASFARSLAALADSLGLDTVAEGIEVPEQAEILRACGWRLGQGWLYGKAGPLPALAGERMQTP